MSSKIHILSQDTVNKIAAGEVIERPMAVAKELIENAIDGSGMEEGDIELAFTPHATSKIQDVTDLLTVSSLGFRGEALASIASVSQLEMLTKTRESLMGVRYVCEGGRKRELEGVGCPEGTTFLVRNLFFNTPARLKFLKTPQTEAGYISGLVERMALSHPDISFRFINQKQTKISRGNRGMMNYFINGRYIKSPVIQRAIQEAYAPYSMQHRYPFTVLHLSIDPQYIDVNVHPQKMEIRFNNEKEIFQSVYHGVSQGLKYREFIPEVTFQSREEREKSKKSFSSGQKAEPFERRRKAEERQGGGQENLRILEELSRDVPPKEGEDGFTGHGGIAHADREILPRIDGAESRDHWKERREERGEREDLLQEAVSYGAATESRMERKEIPRDARQSTLFEEGILSDRARKELKIIGQVFSTYWILQYEDKMYMVDQHAAHEKVLYERFMRELDQREAATQLLHPPIVLSLSMQQQQAVEEHREILERLGYQLEAFGGREYTVSGVPAHLPEVGTQALLLEVIDTLTEEGGRNRTPEILLEKVASMSCKAAVKGNSKLPTAQMEELLKELMTLENPYHCPHGRPTMISMSKTEIEKKFKRIV